MPDYRRVIIPGGTFFFTVVTWQRQPIFGEEFARRVLHEAFEQTRERFPFTMDAICLLPDHLHCIWTLPDGDADYATRWRFLKTMFSYRYKACSSTLPERTGSRAARREAAIWQRRFWEHAIRDEKDFETHVEYIHNNPVKHGLVEHAEDWPWSSYRRWNS